MAQRNIERGSTLNGIDRDRLFESIDAVKADPSKGSCKFFSSTHWSHGTKSETKISRYQLGGEDIQQDYTIAADEPDALLGSDGAANPQMLLYAALSACVLNTFVINAAAKGIPIDSLRIDVEGELDLRGFLGIDDTVNPGYETLMMVCRVEGSGTKEQYEACMAAGTKYSPNFQSLTRPVKIDYRVEVG